MSLLQNLPHRCTIAKRRRQRVADGAGSAVDAFVVLHSNVSCWEQTHRDSKSKDFQKREMNDPTVVYFSTDYALDESHVIIITERKGTSISLTSQKILSVVSNAQPDASAGTGNLWRVMCEYRTGSTINASEVSIIS